MKVWHLSAEVTNAADFEGITTLHRTREGAVKAFEAWLAKAGIPTEVAYDGVQWTLDGFLGGDYQHDDTTLHWGIQPMEVHD